MQESEFEKLKDIEGKLNEKVIGQEEAVAALPRDPAQPGTDQPAQALRLPLSLSARQASGKTGAGKGTAS